MRKVYVSVTTELTIVIDEGVNVDEVVRAWADHATVSDLNDEAGNHGADVVNVELKDSTLIDSK